MSDRPRADGNDRFLAKWALFLRVPTFPGRQVKNALKPAILAGQHDQRGTQRGPLVIGRVRFRRNPGPDVFPIG